METLKIVKGQPFVLWVPTIMLNADGKQAIDASTLTNVAVTAGNGCKKIDIECQPFEHWLVLQFGDDLEVGPYNIRIDGRLESGREFSLALSKAVEIVNWDKDSNWDRFIVGDHIVLEDAPFITGTFYSDAELEALKQEYREKNAQLDEAIAEYERRAAELDGVAQESTLTQGVQDIRADIAGIDTSELAKETTAEAAKQAAQDAKAAAQAIAGYALQGTDPNTTNTAIFAAIGYTIQEIDGV